jgi:hypothetical protein
MPGRLRAGVEEEQAAAPQDARVGVLVQNLAVDRGDNGEREVSARGQGDPVDRRGDLGLLDARPGHAHAREVHVDRDIHGFLGFGDLLGGLDGPLGHDGLDELDGGFETRSLRPHPEPLLKL